MVKQRAVAFDDFSGGDFGLLGSWHAPKGSFTGQNVLVYVDGSIGPRAAAKALALTGVAASEARTTGISAAGEVWFLANNGTVYSFDPVFPGALFTYTGTVSPVSSGVAVPIDDTRSLLSVQTSKVYVVDHDAGTVTAIAPSPTGRALTMYGERAVGCGYSGSGVGNRLYYSNAGDATTWPAANYIDVGDKGTNIVGLYTLRDALVIAKSPTSGSKGEWWVLTGVPGVNETLRKVMDAVAPFTTTASVVLGGGRSIAFVSSPFASRRYTAEFNGSSLAERQHLHVTLNGPAVSLTSESDWMTPDSVQQRGAPTFHTLDDDGLADQLVLSPNNDLVVGCDGNTTPTFYTWQPYLERPPFSSDTYSAVVDPTDVYFSLPDIQAERGEQIAVRKVTVWFRDWDTGGSANQFAVNVTPIRQYEAGEGTTQIGGGSSPSFSRAVGSSSTSGVNLRREWTFAEDWGDAARIKISDMRGVAIHRIEVILDTKAELA